MKKLRKVFENPNCNLTRIQYLQLFKTKIVKELIVTLSSLIMAIGVVLLVEFLIIRNKQGSLVSYRVGEVLAMIISVYSFLKMLLAVKTWYSLIKCCRYCQQWEKTSLSQKNWVYLEVSKISQKYFAKKTVKSIYESPEPNPIVFNNKQSIECGSMGCKERSWLFEILYWIAWMADNIYSLLVAILAAIFFFLPKSIDYISHWLNFFRIEDSPQVRQNYEKMLRQFWPVDLTNIDA
ncbi:hypothetical protein [Mesoplasma seiffertii]|uniref:hypothetical protein n=1 Tax=Mesoplasma seiffertii TaxID=28224 RepID=UPI00047898D7|nr:hypothetical protein [Mesoplasma seiffertii]